MDGRSLNAFTHNTADDRTGPLADRARRLGRLGQCHVPSTTDSHSRCQTFTATSNRHSICCCFGSRKHRTCSLTRFQTCNNFHRPAVWARRRLRGKVSPDCLLCCLTKHLHRAVFFLILYFQKLNLITLSPQSCVLTLGLWSFSPIKHWLFDIFV